MIEFLTATWGTLLELSPWLFLGAIISSLMHKWIPSYLFATKLRGYRGVVNSVILGVPLPLCSCGVIPTGIGLKKDGASDGASIGFLISTPQTGVDSVLTSAAFLGYPFAIFKVLSAGLTGIIGGFLVEAGTSDEQKQEATPSTDKAPPSWGETVEHGIQLIRSIWRWLVVGILLSAAIQVMLPEDLLRNIPDGFLSAFAALVISIPLYVCATASVPIAAALVQGGLPLGAALVFLMAGPATNVATIGSIFKTFGGKSTAIYLATVIIGSMLLGMGFDFLLQDSINNTLHDHEHSAWWQQISAAVLCFALLYFGAEEFKASLPLSKTNNHAPSMTQEYFVTGLSCGGCVSKLKKAFEEEDSIQESRITLESGHVQLIGNITPQRVSKIIEQKGFELRYPSLSIDVEGMTCGGCTAKLKKRLCSLDGVRDASVQLKPGRVFLEGKLSEKQVVSEIRKTGFKPLESTLRTGEGTKLL
ncbi:MAG: permease [Myxococcota bacterium]|nr:permease [Myxococcota bacterium]